MTRSPSVTGEAEHCGLVECVGSLSSGVTPCCQRMGVEFPLSGKGTRQRTLVLVSHRSGRFFSEVTPVPSDPRQAGQLAAGACEANVSDRSARNEKAVVFMECVASMDARRAARISNLSRCRVTSAIRAESPRCYSLGWSAQRAAPGGPARFRVPSSGFQLPIQPGTRNAELGTPTPKRVTAFQALKRVWVTWTWACARGLASAQAVTGRAFSPQSLITTKADLAGPSASSF